MHQELRNGEGKFVSSRDRLSSLPDPILCHILSFLPTKFSVATSILAKRWRSLWTDVPNLDFRMELEPNPTRFGDNLSYSDVINRVMLMNNVRNLNTFRFIRMNSWNDDHQFSANELDTWFRTAIARNVQVVDLDFFFAPLPRCLFTAKTVVELKLLRCAGIPLSGDVCLPSLRKLYLHDIDFGKEEAFYNLISGCPVLEELTIDGLYLDGVYCYKISSPTIKWLLLDFYLIHEKEHHFELDINTPALKYLSIKDDLDPCYVSAGTLNSLVEADIQLNSDYVREVVGYSCSIIQFVERLCQVKCLRLSSYFMEFWESDFAAATSRFYNLTKLELDADWRFLIKFLKCADNLEVLIIREVEKDLKCWTDPEHVPICLSSHLRHVTVDTHGYLEDEFKMVSYILRFAKVLNTMESVLSVVCAVLEEKTLSLKESHYVSLHLRHVSLWSLRLTRSCCAQARLFYGLLFCVNLLNLLSIMESKYDGTTGFDVCPWLVEYFVIDGW